MKLPATALTVATAILALTTGDAAAGTKFRVEITVHLEGTWQRATGLGTVCGAPSEESGSFNSTLGKPPKPLYLIVYRELGRGRVQVAPPRRSSGTVNAPVTSTRAAQGWFTNGNCYPYKDQFGHIPIDNSGCWSKTFTTPLSLLILRGGVVHRKHDMIAPNLYVEPPEKIGCHGGPADFADKNGGYLQDQLARRIDWAALHNCGRLKPRACRKTVGASRTFASREEYGSPGYPTRGGLTVTTATVTAAWSARFVAVGRAS